MADKFLKGRRQAEWQAMEAARLAALPPEPDPDEGARYPSKFWEEELQLAIEG